VRYLFLPFLEPFWCIKQLAIVVLHVLGSKDILADGPGVQSIDNVPVDAVLYVESTEN
jgi:hypothetical protein